MKLISIVFRSTHKVRTYECDFYGHVNNAVYLNYLELARLEILEDRGVGLPRLRDLGMLILIRRVDIAYKYPAKAGDVIAIESRVKEIRGASGTFAQDIIREGDRRLLARATVEWVVVDPGGKPLRMPLLLREAFQEGV